MYAPAVTAGSSWIAPLSSLLLYGITCSVMRVVLRNYCVIMSTYCSFRPLVYYPQLICVALEKLVTRNSLSCPRYVNYQIVESCHIEKLIGLHNLIGALYLRLIATSCLDLILYQNSTATCVLNNCIRVFRNIWLNIETKDALLKLDGLSTIWQRLNNIYFVCL